MGTAKLRPQPFYEDVSAGDALPTLHKGPYTVMAAAKFSALNGDYYPGHYDHAWSVEKDFVKSGVVAHGLQITTYLSQVLTDWYGPEGFLRRFASRVRTQTYAGESLVLQGRVSDKYVEGAQHLVACEVWGDKPDGSRVIEGTAVVRLPSRGGQAT